MDSLAYVTALLVPSGKAGNDMSEVIMGEGRSDSDAVASFGEVVANGAGWMINKAIAGQVLAQNSPPDLVARQVERLVVEPTAPLATVMEVTPERWGSKPRWFIECEQDNTMPIAGQRRLVELFPGTRTATLDADHSPFYSAPEALADALIAAAQAAREP